MKKLMIIIIATFAMEMVIAESFEVKEQIDKEVKSLSALVRTIEEDLESGHRVFTMEDLLFFRRTKKVVETIGETTLTLQISIIEQKRGLNLARKGLARMINLFGPDGRVKKYIIYIQLEEAVIDFKVAYLKTLNKMGRIYIGSESTGKELWQKYRLTQR